MRRRGIILGLAAGATMLAPAALASATPGSHHHVRPFGVVVDWRAASHTATVARPSGQLFAVHTNHRIAVGSVVAIRHLTKLHNGTYAGAIVRLGSTHRARVRGRIVANLGRRGFAIGVTGATFVVRARQYRTGRFNSGLSTTEVGSSVVADVEVNGGTVTEIDMHDTCGCAVPGAVEISGIVTAIDQTSHIVIITDENDGTPVSYTVDMPTSMDLSTLTLGQELHVLGTPNPDGTFTFAVAPTVLQIEGTISAIDTTANTITVTNTDGGATMTFVVDIPSTVNINGFNVGDEIELQVIQNADGTYSMTQCSDNSDGEQADSQSGDQGGSGNGVWTGDGSSDSARHR